MSLLTINKPIQFMLKTIFISLLLVISTLVTAQNFQTKLQTALTNAWSGSGLPGVSVTVSTPDQGMIYASVGIGNVYTSSPIVPATTKYRIASATKNFTAVLIMRLQEAGYFNINDKLSDHITIPGLAYADSMTIVQLLNHTAGVGDFLNESGCGFNSAAVPNKIFTNEEIIGFINNCPLSTFAPGTKYSYSNGGFFVLGMLIEHKLGLSIDVAMQNWIFNPLGLTNTFLDLTSLTTNKIPLLAEGTRAYNYSPTSVKAAGAIVSTTEDMAKFNKAVFGGTYLTTASINALIAPSAYNSAYGLGTRLYTSSNNVKYHGHTGTILGYESFMYYVPSMNLSVGITTNAYASPSSYWTNIKSAVYAAIEQEYLNYCITNNCNAPAAPITTAPTEEQTNVVSPVNIAWTSNETSAEYRVQVSKTKTGFTATNGFTTSNSPDSNVVVNTTTTNKSFVWDNAGLGVSEAPMAATTYFYCVKSTNSTTGASNYSALKSFTTTVNSNCTPPTNANIYVDNLNAELNGAWTVTSATPGFYGTNYIHDGDALKGTKTATFTPTIEQRGIYEIYTRHTAGTNRSDSVPMDIYHENGMNTVMVNQKLNNNTWVSLGRFNLDIGTNNKTVIRTTGTTGVVIADAIWYKFVDCLPSLSTNENVLSQEEIKIYPNPSTGIINIEDEKNRNILVRIYSIVGQKVFEKQLDGETNTIDISQNKTGIYIVELTYGEQSITKKVILKP